MWPTPNGPPTDLVTFRLSCPAAGDWHRVIRGALSEILRPGNWDEAGALSSEDAVYYAGQIYDSMRRAFIMEPGDIFLSYRAISDGSALLCNGGTHAKADYPVLAGTLNGVTWSDATNFRVPDLSGRTPIGSGSGSGLTPRTLDASGGAETHQLTESEMPSHTHTIHSHLTSIAQLGVGEPVTTPNIVGGNTGNRGSDNPHNNMQPFRVSHFYIVTGEG